MKIILHNHGATLAADFSDISTERLERLSRFNVPIDRIELDIRHQSNPHFGKKSHRVAITTHGSGPLLRAIGEGFNDLAAFDEAAEAIELQLRKHHERAKNFDRTTLRKFKAVNR
ncbi:MAG: ribosomal subunit interface protein [Candidatus Nanopelagicaceae bacterium]|nr:ribosomal subunit interface protein [Candidatus Nanopelagicaceae bacterium]